MTPTASSAGLVSSGALVLIVAGCGASESPTELELPVAVVTVSPVNNTVLVGGLRTLTVSAEDSQGNSVSGADFTWKSSNTSVATVGPSGPQVGVSGVAEGVATITATAEGQSGTATVTVRFLRLAAVDPGTFVSCGLATDGAAYCWGRNEILGVGPTTETCESFAGLVPCSSRPRAVLGGITFASLDVANGFTCGLDTSGAAYCWGVNGDGQLGTGDTLRAAVPVAVAGGLTFTSISAGGGHACGLTASGVAYCWGDNSGGQLGTSPVSDTCLNIFSGNNEPCSTTPVAVAGGLTFTSLSVAEAGSYTCGITTAEAAYCWGRDAEGQLGNGVTVGTDQNPTPIAVSGGLNFASVSAGGEHTCGVTVSGEAYCWGSNELGQLGNPNPAPVGSGPARTHAQDSPTPLAVLGGLLFESVSAGSSHTCGVATNGAAYCWGNNFDEQLGTGTGDETVPTPVAGGLTFASVSASWFHTCGLTTGGVGYCWGYNEVGQLGNGLKGLPANAPVRVLGQP